MTDREGKVQERPQERPQEKVQEQTEAPSQRAPNISPATMAERKAVELVGNIADVTLKDLTHQRQELDELMISIDMRRKALVEEIAEFASDCEHAITATSIMREGMRKMQELFPKPVNNAQ